MFKYSKRFGLLLILLIGILPSCMGQESKIQTIQPITIWRISLSPTLKWMEPYLNVCAIQTPGTGILRDNALSEPDIRLFWGENELSSEKISYNIGWDDLKIVVNQRNTVEQLSQSQIRSIFEGKLNSWGDLLPDLQLDLGAIKVIYYTPALDIQAIFKQKIIGLSNINSFAILASDPEVMRMEIARNQSAIGYLPARWLNDSVHSVDIQSNNPLDLRFPILAETFKNPSGLLQQWLFCLQTEINKKSSTQ